MSAPASTLDDPDLPPETFDELVGRLRELRQRAGSPSFSELTERVRVVRVGRGAHARESTVGRMTVYDCFRLGRRRLDVPLVLDIVRALGVDDLVVQLWSDWCGHVLSGGTALRVARLGLGDAASSETSLVGRADELRLLTAGEGPAVITGMPGVGKTELAIQALRTLLGTGAMNDVVVVDLREQLSQGGAADARSLADALARALDVPAEARDAEASVIAAVADATAERRIGVFVDDVSELAPLESLLRALRTPTIVVSRNEAEQARWLRLVELAPWREEETSDYLRASIGADRAVSEPEALQGLAAATGGLPLAAHLLATRILQRPQWRLADHLDELDERDTAPDGPLRASIELSYAALDAQAQRLLRLLATVPSDGLDTAAVGVVADARAEVRGSADPSALSQASILDALQEAQLVRRSTGATLHPVVRSFAVSRSLEEDAPAERRAALDRVLDLYLRRGWAALETSYPDAFERARSGARPVAGAVGSAGPATAEDSDALADSAGNRGLEPPLGDGRAAEFWRTQLPVLIELSAAVGGRRPEVPVEVSELVAHHLDVDGRHRTAEQVHREALRHAEALGSADAIAVAAHRVGQSLVRMGSPYARAELLRAQQLAEHAGNAELVLKASNTLAILAAQGGDLDEAALRFEQAVAAAEHGGLDHFAASLNDNLGIVLRRLGDVEGARSRHGAAHRIARDRGDEVAAGVALVNLSDVEVELGDFSSAADTAREAVRLTEHQAGLPHAYALTNLALAFAGLGDPDAAAEQHGAALKLAESMGNSSLVASVRNNLGELHGQAGRVADAAGHHTVALEVAEGSANAHERARALLGLAEAEIQGGQRHLARQHLEALVTGSSSAAPEAATVTPTPQLERARALLAELDAV
ncbi:tetratricopeptide repeat protein [Pseudoclavibacter sp. JSM 162008]|uniref:tetratricopeptide repeat protein n=1 Tax=Pseudoclavibacter sp. JSM 162008 TaxID=3229855 RepID=UPI003525DC15